MPTPLLVLPRTSEIGPLPLQLQLHLPRRKLSRQLTCTRRERGTDPGCLSGRHGNRHDAVG